VTSVWDGVVGQPRAVHQLRDAARRPVHAYLFIGPPGSTKDVAARAFAALVLTGADDPEQRDARLALAAEHPDVREVERVGARIMEAQISEIIRIANLAPVEGDRKVIILHEFHLLNADGAARPPAVTWIGPACSPVTPASWPGGRCSPRSPAGSTAPVPPSSPCARRAPS
jgi:DNA polymerase-3 subunit delta'